MDHIISPYVNQASAHRYEAPQQDNHNSPVASPKKTTHSKPYLADMAASPHLNEIKLLKPSQLNLNIHDSNIYSQAMSSDNNRSPHDSTTRGANNNHQLNEQSVAGKKSKIIYSINKSTNNKGSNVNRSKALFENNHSGGGGLLMMRRSLESRGSKDKKQMTHNKSTISSKYNQDASQVIL